MSHANQLWWVLMSESAILALLRQVPLSFVGTIEHLGSSTMEVAVDDNTAVVYVDRVLHAPPSLEGLGGQRVTVQLAAKLPRATAGATLAFFVHVLAIGESIAVAEVNRLSLEDVAPYLRHAAVAGERPFAALERQVATESFREHAEKSDAIVLARVVKLEQAPHVEGRPFSEHDPDWWIATLSVYHVERGHVAPGEVRVRYANSLDVSWRASPKPKASQSGLWLLHRSHGEMHDIAPFELLHPEDRQAVQSLDDLRQHRSY